MKYRLKKALGSHPVGTEIFKNDYGYSTNTGLYFIEGSMQKLIEQGIIEEVQEKEFTKNDILEFGFFIENTMYDEECVLATKFHDWLKERGGQ